MSAMIRAFELKAFCITVTLFLAGCASQPTEVSVEPAGISAEDEPVSWWYVRFRLHWPGGEDTLWYPDLLLADRVLRPILEKEREAIVLWRFHRRAARDEAGRRFSFIFRATPATAERVNARIAGNPWIARLHRRGILERVDFDDPGRPTRLHIGDTSDPAWSTEMQVAWPHFIMGVSQLWLELIRELEKQGKWPVKPLARYAAIENAMNEHWHSEGGHALLHHLSAIFGYRELLVTRREVMRF